MKVEIDNVEEIIDKYAEIDAYSQGKLPDTKVDFSARNMGKNDLWIAATTKLIEAELITTDKDFEHLDNKFFKVHMIKQNQ